jgi:ankyrin repeat protein
MEPTMSSPEPLSVNKRETKEMYMACKIGDIHAVKKLIDRGASVNECWVMAPGFVTESPLSTAAGHGHKNICKLLLEAGADIALMAGSQKSSALHRAVDQGHLELAQWLVNQGAPLDLQDFQGKTPLFVAASNCNLEICRWLLKRGAKTELANNSGHTPLLETTKHFPSSGSDPVFDLLVSSGADVHAKNKEGRGALHLTAQSGNAVIFQKMIDLGGDPKEDGLLKIACNNGRTTVISLLMKAGCDQLEQMDKDGFTPLMSACANGHLETALFLLKCGANAKTQCHEGHTTLHTAIESVQSSEDTENLCLELIRRGADPTIKKRGVTAWGLASRKGKKQLGASIKAFHDAHQAAQAVERSMQSAGLKSPISPI